MFGTSEINNEVYKNGEVILTLNKHLIKKQGLTQEDVNRLKELHLERISIEKQLDEASRPEDIKTIFGWWSQNQRELQSAWGFPVDDNWHPSHRLSKCSCGATMDNNERLGTPYKIYKSDCPLHGGY